MNKKRKVFKSTVILLGLAFTFLLTIQTLYAQPENTANPTQNPKPTIDITCELRDIHDDPKEEDFYAVVRFTWKTQNTLYVLIKGYDERQYQTSGSIDVTEGGVFTFVAVGTNGITQKPMNCVHKWEIDKSGNKSKNGLTHKVASEFQSQVFDNAYKITLKTSLSNGEIKNRITRFLQDKQYTVVIDNFRNAPAGDIFFHTSDYNFHPNLCYGDDCSKAVGSRRIERQVAFSIWLQSLARQDKTVTYQLNIRPFVMMNYRRQDDVWKEDRDATQIANPVSRELADAIEQRLR
jgi:hypothetical protein